MRCSRRSGSPPSASPSSGSAACAGSELHNARDAPARGNPGRCRVRAQYLAPVITARLRPVLDEIRPLADLFGAAGRRVYLVGGIVRDLLDGREIVRPDFDLTTDARPDD